MKSPSNKIVCAAIKDSTGKIWLGKRHADCLFLMFRFGVDDVCSTQGYVDEYMNFYNRNEAVDIAYAAGQIDFQQTAMNNKQLYSEDIY